MQVKKEEVYQAILDTAKLEFYEKGFAGTGLREIAKRAGISTSNIYNYFQNKDDLFHLVLKPLTDKIDKAFYSAEVSGLIHDKNAWNYDLFREQVVIVSRFINENRRDLRLLVFQSEGSTLNSYKQELITKYASSLSMKIRFIHRHLSPDESQVSDDFIYSVSSHYFNIMQELIERKLEAGALDQFITEITTFIYFGWRSLLKVDQIISSTL